MSEARTLRVVAPAGSGKTQTIVERIARRIANGVAPARILLLTFDDSAARTLRGRLIDAMGAGRSPRVATLNAFGYSLLRSWAPSDYLPIATREVQEERLHGAIEALGMKSETHRRSLPAGVEERTYIELFSLFKNSLFDPRSIPEQALADFILASRLADPLVPVSAGRHRAVCAVQALMWLFAAHERAMRESGWMDFDDQKLGAWRTLRANRPLRHRVQHRFTEVVVDEFQDINRLDFELIRIIAHRACLLMAGDDDQAIYGFRGCTADYVLDPERHLGRNVASYELRTNYRNAPNLMQRAERLIRYNRRRIPKRPLAMRRDQATIVVCPCESPEAEAAAAAVAIESRLAEMPAVRPRDIAVLYRVHAQSTHVASALTAGGIPHCTQERARAGERGRVRRPPEDVVHLLTYFKAKGLQWNTVLLIGCNAGVVPHPGAPVEDERRLFYVAMTRAIACLTVSYVAAAGASDTARSPFLAEAGLV